MRRARILFTSGILLGSLGCGGGLIKAPVQPPPGLIFTKTKAPLSTDYSATPAGGKVGTASTIYFSIPIWFGRFLSFAWDDASIARAAAEGGITKVTYADYEFMNILGVVGIYTTIAHGE